MLSLFQKEKPPIQSKWTSVLSFVQADRSTVYQSVPWFVPATNIGYGGCVRLFFVSGCISKVPGELRGVRQNGTAAGCHFAIAIEVVK